MALRMIIGALKRAYPRVPVMTTDELQHLMKKTASQSGYRKLVLLVRKRCCQGHPTTVFWEMI